ncbi:hypothetical protein GCM10027589_05890 [Actinocorallia lasiicapitis]
MATKFTQWAEKNFGSDDLALAYCVDAISAACGEAQFSSNGEARNAQLIQMFTGWIVTFHPDRGDVADLAVEFLIWLQDQNQPPTPPRQDRDPAGCAVLLVAALTLTGLLTAGQHHGRSQASDRPPVPASSPWNR